MDNRIKNMQKEQRIALARIVYDIVMADQIIDKEEILKFANLFGEENKQLLFRQAQELSFAKAIKLVNVQYNEDDLSDLMKKMHSTLNQKYSSVVVDLVKEVADSDGFCAPSEAILLLAINYYLKSNDAVKKHYDIQSFKLTDIFIGKRFVLYVENGNSQLNSKIENNYDLIVNLLSSIGFQFIYIPKLVEQYEKMGAKMFKTMSMYIFPDIKEDKIEEVYGNILKMTTTNFVKKYLYDKLGFDIVCSNPALMIMLGRSSVIGKDLSDKGLIYNTYANFLKINIDKTDDVLNIINKFVVDFNELVSFKYNIDFNPAKDKLIYHGIHKAFFRLVALAKKSSFRYNININTNLGCVFINDRKLPLPLGKTAIYIMVLWHSFFGDQKGLPMRKRHELLSESEKHTLQSQYEWICLHLGVSSVANRSPLYPNVQNRMTDIRSAITDIVGKRLIGEIQIGMGEYIKTIVSPELVTVNNIPIKEHPEWSKLV